MRLSRISGEERSEVSDGILFTLCHAESLNSVSKTATTTATA
jgi:hypothetical protein